MPFTTAAVLAVATLVAIAILARTALTAWNNWLDLKRAELARPLDGSEGAVFASGTLMLKGEDKPLAPAELQVLSEREVLLTITEGRYHQVRRMFAAIGNHVETLHREGLGGLTLPADLAPGQWALLSQDDIALIFAARGP
jgi:16S rRNA pseudouridine516 synthase